MLQVARILKVHRRYLVGIGNSFRRNILLCLCLEKGGKFMENKAESLSKQALNMVPGYFADGEVHRGADFIRYALQNSPAGMKESHIKSALYRAKESGFLQSEGRGLYRLCGDRDSQTTNTGKLLQRLKKASTALDWTVSICTLSDREIAAIREIQQIRSRMDALADMLRHTEDTEPSREPLS